MSDSTPLPDRHSAYALLASAALVLAPHAAYQPWWLSLGVLALLAWRYFLTARAWTPPGRVVRIALVLLAGASLYRYYGTVVGRDAGVGLLCVLLGLKLLELRTLRDYLLAGFLLYFLILASFLFSQSLWLAAYLFTAVWLCTAMLVRLALPGSETRAALRLAARMLLQAVPLMVLMYLLFPRIQGSLWSLPGDSHGGVSGMSDELRPGSINQLSLSDAIAFRASFDGAPPPANELYWRSLVLWHTDGHGWTRGDQGLAPERGLTRVGDAVTYSITFEPTSRAWLVALDLPGTLPPTLRARAGYVLETRGAARERLRYQLSSWTRYQTGALSARERGAALQLPPTVGERTLALAQTWRAAHAQDAEIAQAALAYFHTQGFAYTLQPPRLGADPVEEFLFDTRRGYCEHYASAFVTLMRAAGLPARVVAGYQGGEYNPAGGYLIVRQADAHAWAEVWLAERGWVRVDPTSAVAPERIDYGADAMRRLARTGAVFGALPEDAIRRTLRLDWLEQLTHSGQNAWDALNIAWDEWVLDYSVERQRNFLRRLGIDTPSPTRLVTLLAAGVALLISAYAVYGWRREPVRDPVQRAYLAYCRKLARAGLGRAPHEGALAYSQRVARRRPDLAAGVQVITSLYLQLHYGNVDSAALRTALRRQVARFRPARSASGRQ